MHALVRRSKVSFSKCLLSAALSARASTCNVSALGLIEILCKRREIGCSRNFNHHVDYESYKKVEFDMRIPQMKAVKATIDASRPETKYVSKGLEDTREAPKRSPNIRSLKPVQPKKKYNTKPIQPISPATSDLPFDFQYSYSESNPQVEPIGFREPKRFSPFGPGRLDREWSGTTAPTHITKHAESWMEKRNQILGDPLTEVEVADLVERYRHCDCNRQINLGKGGVTHNMLDDVHNHWKRAEAVRIKCLGVPTLDMDNVCFHLEEKTCGKIIHRNINVLLIYRGRNYCPKERPVIPQMLWKPLAPIYPKLVKNVADGLTFEETKEMRNTGLNSRPIIKLSRNGVYVNVVEKVREAFKNEEVVRLDCSYVGMSDCKKIGVKLRDLVPCVPILFKAEQIILWRGKTFDEKDPKNN